MTSRRFQVGEAILSANNPQLAPALADAHARRIRPLCLCRQPGAPMYVARVAGQFITKRMPGTGVQHDPACESYEAPPELSGFGDVVGRAIQEDADSGVTVLRLVTLWDAVPGAHLIVIATFGVAPSGVTTVEELALGAPLIALVRPLRAYLAIDRGA